MRSHEVITLWHFYLKSTEKMSLLWIFVYMNIQQAVKVNVSNLGKIYFLMHPGWKQIKENYNFPCCAHWTLNNTQNLNRKVL